MLALLMIISLDLHGGEISSKELGAEIQTIQEKRCPKLIEYKDDVDLRKKLNECEAFYNHHRPHGGLKGMTPYEVLKKR